MNAVSPARVIERVRLAQQSQIDPDTVLRDTDADLQDEVEGALRLGQRGRAQRLLITALDDNPHLIDAQLMLIDATPSLSEFDRANLFEELQKTYWHVVERSSPHGDWSISQAFARTALIVVSRLASYYESVGRLLDATNLRWKALQVDKRDGWGNRYYLAGHLLLLGDPRREQALWRRNVKPIAQMKGKIRYPSDLHPFWIMFDLVRAIIRQDSRVEQIYEAAQGYQQALSALIAGDRPNINPDGPHTFDDIQIRMAYFLWPAVRVHARARLWIAERVQSKTR